MKILLFDIDGVLVKGGSMFGDVPTRTCFAFAIKKLFDIDVEVVGKEISGKTDTQILLDLLEEAGVSRAEGWGHIVELRAAAVEFWEENKERLEAHTCPGVESLLMTLKERGYHMGLLTGNLPRIAEIKLGKLDIYKYFEFGGFGDVSDVRSKLIEDVLVKAEKKFGAKIERKNVFYFGDSPRDVKAGREAGVRIIGVPTGHDTKEELGKSNPDYMVDSLEQQDEIFRIIGKAN